MYIYLGCDMLRLILNYATEFFYDTEELCMQINLKFNPYKSPR